jgi:hypothetical protein
VTARIRSSFRSLHHQCRDLHRSTYLYLLEDRYSTPHQVVSDFMVTCEVLSCAFYLVFAYLPSSNKKPKNIYTFRCPITLRAVIFIFRWFVEFVSIMVDSYCWFGFMFVVCSTPLCAFGCAARLIPPLQQQTNPLHSSVCPASYLVLIFHFASHR